MKYGEMLLVACIEAARYGGGILMEKLGLDLPVWVWWTVIGGAAAMALCLFISGIKAWLSQQHTKKAASKAPAEPKTVDYIKALAIVDRYIAPATHAMRSGTLLSVRHDFLDRFDKVTGAKLGEYEYNHALLHQWMQSNAARFLVEKRHEMQ